MIWVSCLAASDGNSLHIGIRKNAFDQITNSFSPQDTQKNDLHRLKLYENYKILSHSLMINTINEITTGMITLRIKNKSISGTILTNHRNKLGTMTESHTHTYQIFLGHPLLNLWKVNPQLPLTSP